MTFNTLVFLFCFLPAALLLGNLVPGKAKNIVLLVLSLLFYAWGDPQYLPVLLLLIVFSYAAGREIGSFLEQDRLHEARTALIIGVVFEVLVLAVFKYTRLSLPMGISFFTFSSLSYLFDVYGEAAEAEKDPVSLALYISFFGKLTSGPIVMFADMQEQLKERHVTRTDLGIGANLFLIGLFKKVLIADRLGASFAAVTALPALSCLTAWLGVLFYSFQLYFDFSGYSDMAIGLSRMFGFRFARNFDYPYTSVSISDFWRRWHISLGSWFREYVYIPLGGNRCTAPVQIRNLLAVWILTGIWHGSTWNFVFWGLYHGALVLLDKFVLRSAWEKVPKALRVILTDLAVFIGWIFFFSPSLGSAFGYLGKLFGSDGVGLVDGTGLYYLRSNLLLLLIAGITSGPLVKKWHDKLACGKNDALMYVSLAGYALLFVLCVAGMISATYSTFLYAAF